MTDDERGLTPEEQERVRRLLVDARHTEPMPQDVAARLDRVLADLARGEEVAPVTSLAARRRRRAATMLVAAAAVVVVGIGLGQVLGTGSGSDSSADRSVPAAQDAPGGSQAESSGAGGGADSLAPSDGEGQAAKAPEFALREPVQVRPRHFARDAREVQRTLDRIGATDDTGRAAHPFECAPGDWGAGRLVPATYAGQPSVLVFRAVSGDTQVVDLFPCGGSEALRSITLPAP